jgi:HSP20 family protein
MLLRFDPFRDLTGDLTPAWRRPMPVDAVRTGDEVVVTVDLPGVDPADLDVTVDNQVLTITATRSSEQQVESSRVIATERSRGRMTRQFTLGKNVDADGITAQLDQGVLTVRLPVAETAKPRHIEIGTPAPAAIETGAEETGETGETGDTSEDAAA